jgi:glycine cleavage system aminomethyltransferase T
MLHFSCIFFCSYYLYSVCIGRGRIEKFAILAEYCEERFQKSAGDCYDVLSEKDIITDKLESIGYVTSVAQSINLGTTVAIGSSKIKINSEKVFYKNMHWKQWRVAKVEEVKSRDIIF